MIKERQSDRVTIRMSGKLGGDITEITEMTPAQNPTEVVRRALAVYHNLVMEKAGGAELLIISSDAEGKPVKKPIFL